MPELNREAIETEIASVEAELEAKIAELDEVRKLLDKDPIEDIEDDLDDEEDDDIDDDTDEDEDDEFVEDEEEEDEDLKAKEAALSEEVLVLQMKLIALNKRLNDIIANTGREE